MINADLMGLARKIVHHCQAVPESGGCGMATGQYGTFYPAVPARDIPEYCDEIIFVYRYLVDNTKREERRP